MYSFDKHNWETDNNKLGEDWGPIVLPQFPLTNLSSSQGRDGGSKVPPTVKEDWACDH